MEQQCFRWIGFKLLSLFTGENIFEMHNKFKKLFFTMSGAVSWTIGWWQIFHFCITNLSGDIKYFWQPQFYVQFETTSPTTAHCIIQERSLSKVTNIWKAACFFGKHMTRFKHTSRHESTINRFHRLHMIWQEHYVYGN